MASSTQSKAKKAGVEREILRQNGVDYFLKWDNMGPPPRHLDTLRKSLIDTSCALSTRLVDEGTGRLVIAQDLARLGQLSREQIEKRFEEYRSMVEAAQHLQGNQVDENEWRNHYKQNFLNPLYHGYELNDLDSRLTSRTKFYYDHFQRREDAPWTLFHREGAYHKRRQNLTYPKPDWVAHFPICDPEHPSAPGFTKGPLWDWSSSKNREIVHEFDRKNLQRLAKLGLQCHVADALNGIKNEEKVDPKTMFSFPWLIVEFKKTDGNYTDCYCQAANAAACTLLMFETLSQFANKEHDQAQIPPVITMTAVGKDVKIWIGYAGQNAEPGAAPEEDKDYNWFHSRCIWEGDMTKVKDAMNLEAILENIHTWAMRVLRPRIVQYLNQWERLNGGICTPSPQLQTKEGDDIHEYVRYGFEGAEERLRKIMVAFHDDTLERIEELLSINLAGIKPKIRKDASSQTDTSSRMDVATQTSSSLSVQTEIIPKTNAPPYVTTQSTGASTSSFREKTARADGNTSSTGRQPAIKVNDAEYDAKSDTEILELGHNLQPSQRFSDRKYASPRVFHRPPLLFGGTRTESEPPLKSTDRSENLLEPESSPPIPEHFARSDTNLLHALSSGDTIPTSASQDNIRLGASVPTATTFDNADFSGRKNASSRFDFRFSPSISASAVSAKIRRHFPPSPG